MVIEFPVGSHSSEVLRLDRKKEVFETDLGERSVFGEEQGAAFKKSQV